MFSKHTLSSSSRAIAAACILSIGLTACGGSGSTVGAPIGISPTPALGSSAPTAAPSGAGSVTATPTHTATPAPTLGATTGPNSAATDPSVPFAVPTDSDPFYAQPSSFPNATPGTILASRSVSYSPGGVAQPNQAWQLRFVSRDENGLPIAAIATVVKPLTPVTSGVEPLLVNDFAEDALGWQCAPSHDISPSGLTTNEVDELPLAAAGLAAGWTVVFPDHEGPYSEYVVGLVEGHVSLDSIRAAEQFAPLGLNAQTPVGLNGYSGGAEAVAWATALHATYAPALNLVGTASGGTPADITGILKSIDASNALSVVANQAFFSIIFMSTVGINRGYPTFLTPLWNSAGYAAAKAMQDGCSGKNSDGSNGPTGHFSDFISVANPYAFPEFAAGAAAVTLPQPGDVPNSDMFIYQSQTDELIPIAGVDALVASWCASGVPIDYYRAVSGDHVTTEPVNVPFVLAYLTAKFGGTTPAFPPTTTACNGG